MKSLETVFKQLLNVAGWDALQTQANTVVPRRTYTFYKQINHLIYGIFNSQQGGLNDLDVCDNSLYSASLKIKQFVTQSEDMAVSDWGVFTPVLRAVHFESHGTHADTRFENPLSGLVGVALCSQKCPLLNIWQQRTALQ